MFKVFFFSFSSYQDLQIWGHGSQPNNGGVPFPGPGSCSRLRGKSVQRLQWCRLCAGWRGWAERLDLPVDLLWVVTERTRSRVQSPEMSFLCRMAGLPLRDRARSSAIREELEVEPVLLRTKRTQMRWFRNRVKMPPRQLPGEVFRARSMVEGPREDPEHAGETMSLGWPGNASGSPPEELDEVAGERGLGFSA